MPEIVFIPFPKSLYDDLIRFSDGRCDPAWLAQSKIESWIDYNLQANYDRRGWIDDDFARYFDERAHELAEKYAPAVLESWRTAEDDEIATVLADRQPLIWKEVAIPAGSEVRMSYGGAMHFARVTGGKIRDDDGGFSPSEWAYKVAGNTSRNAWRDLWFKAPSATNWIPASVLRQKFRDASN